MKLIFTLLAVCAASVSAAPYGDHGYSGKEICKGHDWSACRKQSSDQHRRSGWTKDKMDWCKDYKQCKDYKEDHREVDDKHDWEGDKHWESTDSFPFTFTQTLVAHAGPDQVVNHNQTIVPGLPDGYGLFQFGLNSKEDVICYVSLLRRCRAHASWQADPLNSEHFGVYQGQLLFGRSDRYTYPSSGKGKSRTTKNCFPQPCPPLRRGT